MGTSGTSLFNDDVANDVRRDFLGFLGRGVAVEDAVAMLKRDWKSAVQDADDGPVFWLALASTQWSYGCLCDEVKQRAVEVVDSGADLARCTGKSLERRREVLAALKLKLLSPQPRPKRPRIPKQAEPPARFEVQAPDGLGKAVAFNLKNAPFMQVYVERTVGGSRGGGSIFVADCAFDDVEVEWLPGPTLRVTYPDGVTVHQRAERHFYSGEEIRIVYQRKEVLSGRLLMDDH